ncbi:MAG: hypothetical protein WBG19_10285 [Thermoplasmata archaeon]
MAGSHPPPSSPHVWEAVLRARLARAGVSPGSFRLIRSDGARAVAEIDHRAAAPARAAWQSPPADVADFPLVPWKTWGTLVGAKAWLRGTSNHRRPRRAGPASPP